MSEHATPAAQGFVNELAALRPADAQGDEPFAGIGMGQIFKLAKEYQAMPPAEIEQLLESDDHPVRVGAVSIMDWQARDRKTPVERRRELFDLYIRRHDRINTWDLVDRSAIHVVGEYLVDKPRDILDELARSARPMERRTAILSTYAFIRRDQLDDTYRIAETLANDPDDLVDKAVGWMLREAGKRDQRRLASFLDAHAATMPRVMLRYSIEKLDKAERDRYLAMKRRWASSVEVEDPAARPRTGGRAASAADLQDELVARDSPSGIHPTLLAVELRAVAQRTFQDGLRGFFGAFPGHRAPPIRARRKRSAAVDSAAPRRVR